MDPGNELKKHTAEPIRNLEDIKLIRRHLQQKPRDLLLFDLAIQTGIGMKKLLQLKTKHLLNLKVGDNIHIKSSKNGKYSVVLTETVYKTFHEYLSKVGPDPDDYLFKSKKGKSPINLSSASNMIKGWFKAVNIENTSGALSLRKTWEYNRINRSPFGQDNHFTIPSSLFKPIEISTAQEIIFRKLSEAIISCRIPPGTRLTTEEISKAFNVSQAPARVALNWLEAKGFITSKKKKASIVKELSIEELKELIKIRLILETAAVDLSIEVCTEATLDLADTILLQVENARTLEEHDRFNTQFHKILYRDACMPRLLQMIEDTCNRISPYAILYNSAEGITFEKGGPIEFHHRGMVEGMRNKDRDKVIKHLELDLGKATPHLEEILKVVDRHRSGAEDSRMSLPSIL